MGVLEPGNGASSFLRLLKLPVLLADTPRGKDPDSAKRWVEAQGAGPSEFARPSTKANPVKAGDAKPVPHLGHPERVERLPKGVAQGRASPDHTCPSIAP